jgi:hypothetical protein
MKAKTNKKNFIRPLLETGYKKILKLYYNVDISEEFIICANEQLDKIFRSATLLNDYPAWLNFEPQKSLGYQRGIV